MDSLAHVENVLASFLRSKEPGVLSVKGAWGVGKTYLWNRFIECQSEVEGCTGYAYVSLFGVTSIAELKRAIFTKLRPLGPKRNRFRRWIDQAGSKLARHTEFDLGPLTGGLSLKNTDLWAEAIEDRALKEVLVCIDDLERKDKSVTTSALLGFITNLRDERRCKVVLLYNEENAQQVEDIRPVLSEYREKAIDREVVLQPTVRECYQLVYPDDRFTLPDAEAHTNEIFDWHDTRSLRELFDAMGLANIRVMQKVRAALEYLEAGIKQKYPKLWPDLVRQTAKLGWLHYCHERAFPIEDVADQSRWLAICARRKRDNGPDKEMAKYQPVERVAYQAHPTDRLVTEFLRSGYVDWAKVTSVLEKQEAEYRRHELGAQYSANWNMVWDNFQASAAQVCAAHLEFLGANHASMSLSEVQGVVHFLREYGPSPEAEAILEDKIAAYVRDHAEEDPRAMDLHLVNEELAGIIRTRLDQVSSRKSVAEAIELLTREGGWNPRDLRYLHATTTAEFREFLAGAQSGRLLHRVKTFRERFAADEGGKEIVARLDSALRELAERSPLDHKRVYQSLRLRPPPPLAGNASLGGNEANPRH